MLIPMKQLKFYYSSTVHWAYCFLALPVTCLTVGFDVGIDLVLTWPMLSVAVKEWAPLKRY